MISKIAITKKKANICIGHQISVFQYLILLALKLNERIIEAVIDVPPPWL